MPQTIHFLQHHIPKSPHVLKNTREIRNLKRNRIRDKLYVKQAAKLNGRDQISNVCVLITIYIFFSL